MLSVVGLLFAAVPSSASIIFSNLGPADSFSLSGPGVAPYAIGDSGFGQYLAVVFVPTVNTLLTDVRVAVSRGPGQNDSFVGSLYSDAAGLPGVSLEDFTPNPASLPASASLFTFTSVGTALVGGTPYWIVLHSIDPANDSGLWYANNTGQGGFAYQWTFTATQPWTFISNATPALEINGVPEPSSIALFLTGAGLIGWRLRKRGA